MRVILPAGGIAAILVSGDDVVPERGILQKDLAEFVGALYNFNVAPEIGRGVPVQANLVLSFQSGHLTHKDEKIPITSVSIFPDGYAVTAMDTDLADIVLSDFISNLDSRLKYRFSGTDIGRLYSSALVVEFDHAFFEQAATLMEIRNILNDTIDPGGRRYHLNRLAFSTDWQRHLPVTLTVRHSVPPDVLIEPRAGESGERGRFFCGAPLQTRAHIRLLERIEQAVLGQPPT